LGFLLLVGLVITLFGLYIIVPQAQKVIDIPIPDNDDDDGDDDRDENPAEQASDDTRELTDKFGLLPYFDWNKDGNSFDWDNDGDSGEFWDLFDGW